MIKQNLVYICFEDIYIVGKNNVYIYFKVVLYSETRLYLNIVQNCSYMIE